MFNVRVYGLLTEPERGVLVTDEWIKGLKVTKFCGGGLEYGEGTIACLKREFLEEMQLPIEVESHFYTTDFFQPSAFHPDHQIISIYYCVKALEEIRVPLHTEPFDFDEAHRKIYEATGETEIFRFIPWSEFLEESMSLPIDKVVARKMIEGWTPNS